MKRMLFIMYVTVRSHGQSPRRTFCNNTSWELLNFFVRLYNQDRDPEDSTGPPPVTFIHNLMDFIPNDEF